MERKFILIYSEEDREELVRLMDGLREEESCELLAVRPLGFFLANLQERFPDRFAMRSIESGPRLWKYLIERRAP